MPFIKCPECGKLNSVKLKKCPKCETPLDMTGASSFNSPLAPGYQATGAAPASPWTQPAQPQNSPWGQPAQPTAPTQPARPQNNPWGQPAQPAQPQNNPWGQPAPQTAPPTNPWSQPAQHNNPWGQPAPQPAPQTNLWAQPTQPGAPQNNPWGQPAPQTAPQTNPWAQPSQPANAAPTVCPNCGNQVMSGAKFCSTCGTPMQQPVQPAGIPTRKNPYCL